MNQISKYHSLFFTLALFVLTTAGCVKEEFSYDNLDVSMDLETSLAAPLGFFDYDLDYKPVFFRFRDTLAVDLSKLKLPDDSSVKEAIFKLYYENSYPAELDFRVFLTTENFTITDTLFESSPIIQAAGAISNSSEEPQVVSGNMEASISGDRIDNLYNTRYIIGEAYIMNESFMETETFESQNLYINLGLVFKIEANTRDL